MRHIIIASHHRFAAGLADTMDYIGNIKGVDVICAYVGETPLDRQVAELFASYSPEDEVLVLTDILQGSVNQAFAPYMGEHVFLVTGTNVALALELALAAEPLTIKDIEDAIGMAQQSMRLMNTARVDIGEEDE